MPIYFPCDGDGNSVTDQTVISEMSNSITSGGSLQFSGNPTKINITAGTGYIIERVGDVFTKINLTWPQFTLIDIVFSPDISESTNYMYLDKDLNVIQTFAPTPEDLRQYIGIGRLLLNRQNDTLFDKEDIPLSSPGPHVGTNLKEFADAVRPIKTEGNIVSPAIIGGNLQIFVSGGIFYDIGISYKAMPNNPSSLTTIDRDPVTFFYLWQEPANPSGFDFEIIDTINPGRYDDGTGGDGIQPDGVLTINKWQIHRVFYSNQNIAIEYGQNTYNTQEDAISNLKAPVVTVINPPNAPLLGWIVIRGGAVDLNLSADAVFINTDRFGG